MTTEPPVSSPVPQPAPAPGPGPGSGPVATPSARAPLYVAAAVGLVVGALIVGVLWLTVGSSSGSAVGGSGKQVTAPAKVGDYQRFADIPNNATGPGKTTAERITAWNRQTAQRISDSYGGAAATVETYATSDLMVIFTVQVVRADSPELFVPYQDPKTLGLAEVEQDVKTFGDVQCIVHVQARAAENPSPSQVVASDCQRTGGGLTVRVPTAGGDLGEHPDQLAAVVDKVFDGIR